MTNTHFRHTVISKTGASVIYRGPDVASEATARKRLDGLYPAGPRLHLERYESRTDSWKPVLVRDFDATAWTAPGK